MNGATMVVATIPVSDLERARSFYGGVLGLTQLWENPASIRFRCGDLSELTASQRCEVHRSRQSYEAQGRVRRRYGVPLRWNSHRSEFPLES